MFVRLVDLLKAVDGVATSDSAIELVDLWRDFSLARPALKALKASDRNALRSEQLIAINAGRIACPQCNAKFLNCSSGFSAYLRHLRLKHGWEGDFHCTVGNFHTVDVRGNSGDRVNSTVCRHLGVDMARVID